MRAKDMLLEKFKARRARDLELEKLKLVRRNQDNATRATVLTEGYKGLALVNGASAVALLTFFTAMWEKHDALPLKQGIVYAIGILTVGVFLSSFVFFFRYWGAFHPNTYQPRKNPYWWWQMIFGVGSASCFLIAVGLVLRGACKVLCCF
jgi:hypothetical protein